MKNTYIILYFLSGLIFLISLLGGSMTKKMFDSLSEKTIETSGFKKSYFESVDNQIDELIYKSKQIELKIEKLKNFFSTDKVDESKYQKEKSPISTKSLHGP